MDSRDPEWPAWWEWEIELTTHLVRRMTDRGFSETDLREMFAAAATLSLATEPGRWLVGTTHAGRPWTVVVEPDRDARSIVVITAYPLP